MNDYRTVETTRLTGARNFSFQSDKDIENGAIVGKGELVAGERDVYVALDDFTDGKFLVANPAWSYNDNSVTDQNEENFINPAGVSFRVYELKKDHKFKIGNIAETFEKNDVLKYDATTGKFAKDASGDFKVETVDEVGFPYCIGSIGAPVPGDTSNAYGYATGAKGVKYVLRVIK